MKPESSRLEATQSGIGAAVNAFQGPQVTAFGSQSMYSESIPISAYEGGDKSTYELHRAQGEVLRLQAEM